MIGSKVLAFASGVAMLSSLSFAWSISGTVVSETGEGIPEVNISAFNYGSISAKTDAAGKFAVANEASSSLRESLSQKTSVHYAGNTLSLNGINAQSLHISLIDALGKVMYDKDFRNVYGNLSLDLSKISNHRASFLRITENRTSCTYALTAKGALLKEGDEMAKLMFSKTGYENLVYIMQAEIESNVVITMKASGQQVTPASSSSTESHNPWNPFGPSEKTSSSSVKQDTPASSSAKADVPASSSEKAETPASSNTATDVGVNCAGKTYPAGDHNMSVNVDGKNRTFIMHVPSAYKGDKPVPLVVDYHPIMGSGAGQMSGTQYKSQTDPEGVISLYPDGSGDGWSGFMKPGWNVGPCCSAQDDVQFSREMIKAVEEKVCIDPKRVYATGFSMGGGMSNHVACFMSDVYAAVAPAGMDLNTVNSEKCNPERPISIIMFRGTEDGTCKYGGGDSGFNDGLNFLGAKGNFKFWAEKNGCTGNPTTNSNGCEEYSNCKDGVKVVLCTDKNTNTHNGKGHDQGDGTVGWPFLKQFTLP